MRQYTSNGSLSGWSGRLDLNKFRGDRAAWRKYANPDDKGTASLPNVKPTSQPTTAPTVDLNALATRTIRGDFGNDPASLFTEPRIGISPGIDHIPLFARQSYTSQRF